MDQLKDLKDIHLPDPVSFWPPAPIWYLVAALALFALIAIVYFIWKRQRNKRLQKRALKELEKIEQYKNPTKKILQLSELLRRVAIKVYSRQEVAGLSGKAWLQLLDQGLKTNEFTAGVGNIISTIPYQKIPSKNLSTTQIKALLALTKKWLLTVTKAGHHV